MSAMTFQGSETLFKRMNEVHELVIKIFENMMEAEGLTLPQYYLLKTLQDCDKKCKMSELATMRLQSPSAVTGITDRLVHLGLVERGFDEKDRRIILLSLTDRAVCTLETITAGIQAFMENFFGQISPKDLSTVNRVIGDLADFLSEELKPQKAK
jgi:DNA-binding MarR family transcriptional regulator